MMSFRIDTATELDMIEIINIADEGLGKNYLNQKVLQRVLFEKNTALKVAKTASNEVVGFVFTFIQNYSSLSPKLQNTFYHKAINASDKICVLKTIAVKSRYKNQGGGSALVQEVLKYAAKKNAAYITTIAWKENNKINLAGILTRNGFHKVRELPNYWKEESMQNAYYCPLCHEPPCICTAVIFEKKC